nr:MAG TPA: hypothetical protein [Caudoviricetes sp.]DAX90529.1 MAG TPA: hypothetical protein [Caudoviricetes sp.]
MTPSSRSPSPADTESAGTRAGPRPPGSHTEKSSLSALE